ncbi:unnamed protein product, partial [Owenia fusiformis]
SKTTEKKVKEAEIAKKLRKEAMKRMKSTSPLKSKPGSSNEGETDTSNAGSGVPEKKTRRNASRIDHFLSDYLSAKVENDKEKLKLERGSWEVEKREREQQMERERMMLELLKKKL